MEPSFNHERRREAVSMEKVYELIQKGAVRHGVIYTRRWNNSPRLHRGRPYDGAVIDKDGRLVITKHPTVTGEPRA